MRTSSKNPKFKQITTFDISYLNTIGKPRNKSKRVIKGVMFNTNSRAIRCFKHKGVECVCCGIKGEYFALEIDTRNPTFGWLRLYAVREGKPVMMTRDHIVPRSKAHYFGIESVDSLENLQPMCVKCNQKKADHFECMA